jgi:hypothetical protein
VLTWGDRFRDIIRTSHAWASIYYLNSPHFTRTQRLTVLLNILVCVGGSIDVLLPWR